MKPLLLLILLTACGGVHEDQPTPCDPHAADSCPAGEACRVVGQGQMICIPLADAGLHACTPASCPIGQSCLRVEGHQGCHPVCALDDRECPDDGECQYEIIGSTEWGVCSVPCTLGDTCGTDSTCATVPGLPHLVCVANGPIPVEGDCSQARCASGLSCLVLGGSPRCRPLCSVTDQSACDARGCQNNIEGLNDVGYCP